MSIRLGVNIDHVATIRQARKTHYPDPIYAAELAVEAGADGITLHLREDRRHIQDHDLSRLKNQLSVPMNLEMAVTNEMLSIAEKIKPEYCCLVPEKRAELTTEGGLDVIGQHALIKKACERLASAGVKVSLFIDPDMNQIDAAKSCGAPIVELHTGSYADAHDALTEQSELKRLHEAAIYANKLGLIVNAGHGLTIENVKPITALPHLNELNIGHSIIARALFVGMKEAVREMKVAINKTTPE